MAQGLTERLVCDFAREASVDYPSSLDDAIKLAWQGVLERMLEHSYLTLGRRVEAEPYLLQDNLNVVVGFKVRVYEQVE